MQAALAGCPFALLRRKTAPPTRALFFHSITSLLPATAMRSRRRLYALCPSQRSLQKAQRLGGRWYIAKKRSETRRLGEKIAATRNAAV
jgi:hypothetical protein